MMPVSTKADERFDLAVAVVVIFVGGPVGDLDREERDGGGDEIDGGVRGLGQHTERSGEDSGEQFEQRNNARGDDGKDRCRAFDGVRRRRRPAGWRFVHGRGAHGRNATGSAAPAHPRCGSVVLFIVYGPSSRIYSDSLITNGLRFCIYKLVLMTKDFRACIYKPRYRSRIPLEVEREHPFGKYSDSLITNGLRFCIYKYVLMAKDFQACIYK